MKVPKVGTFSQSVIAVLGLSVTPGTPIYLGESNTAHMQSKHKKDYEKYGSYIPEILNNPDYVRKNPKNDSIEYVKEFRVDGEFVKVAVRISGTGTWFARSIYILNNNRVQNFINKGTLKKP